MCSFVPMNQQPLQFAHVRPAYQRGLALVLLPALVMLSPLIIAQERIGFRRTQMVDFEGATFAGAALIPGDKASRRVLGWGNAVVSIAFPSGKETRISAGGGFGTGGCVLDVNSDGQPDLLLFEKGPPGETGRMVWLEAPKGELHVIDTDADFTDCLPTQMFGTAGVALLHRHSQLRFYEIPADPNEKWSYRELYSIYTPSAQSGLISYDVDGNGQPDFFGGNYWFQAPPSADKPWHIFAINKWWENAQSAMLKLALVPHADNRFPSLLAAEATASPARVALFDPGKDPKQLWKQLMVEAVPPIRHPEALAAADLNGDSLTDIIIGENAGDGSRLLIYWGMPGGTYQGTRIDLTGGLIAVWPVDYNGDGRMDLIGLGPSTFYVWRNQPLKTKP